MYVCVEGGSFSGLSSQVYMYNVLQKQYVWCVSMHRRQTIDSQLVYLCVYLYTCNSDFLKVAKTKHWQKHYRNSMMTS